jgi:L-lysine 2,3-aminomutase
MFAAGVLPYYLHQLDRVEGPPISKSPTRERRS